MGIILTVEIKNCRECRHIDHSGAFTPGGAKPICGHPNVSNCVKEYKNLRDEDANYVADSDLGKQCWYWKNRVIPYKRVESPRGGGRTCREAKGTIPQWCPLKNGSKY